MAATDQTYRKLKTVHVVFGVSCLLMLLSVLWMFVQDFDREYKPTQRQFRDVEEQANLRVMLQQLPRGEDLQEKINTAKTARQEYAKAQSSLRDLEKKLSADREVKDTTYRTIKASYDAQASYYDIAVDEASKATEASRSAELDKEVTQKRESLAQLRAKLAQAQRDLDDADEKLKEEVTDKLKKPKEHMEDAEDDLKRSTGAFDRFAKATAQKSWRIGDTIRALPIIDGFSPPTKISQIVLNELPIDYSFKQVPRYDRCTTCHLGIDRGMFDKTALIALTQQNPALEKSLTLAKKLLLERQRKGEDLGFDPHDLPSKPQVVALTKGEITQFATHPRFDLFVDSNSPHNMEKFGCTICHAGQGSSTSFVLASHTPADTRQTEEWKKNHDWKAIHDWDFPMHSTRFVESSCLQCHHQVTDLIRYGSKEEAPKLLRGYNLVKENGCFGCHEISGIKGGRPVGPDLRLEATPALELLSAADQDKARADSLNPPGAMRKVGPSLRRVAEKTNEEWARKWIQAPRNFREDTKMPHFYGLSNNKPEVLPDDQKKFPDAEIHAIAHYIFAESKDHLKAGDTYRKSLLETINNMYDLVGPQGDALLSVKEKEPEEYKELEQKRLDRELTERKDVERWAALDRKVRGGVLAEKERKELSEATRSFANLALLSEPTRALDINTVYAELKQHQDRLQELKGEEDDLRRRNPPEVLDADALKNLQDQWSKVKAATAKLVALAKPVSVKERVVDFEGKVVDKDTIMKGDGDAGKNLFIEKGCMACHSNVNTEPTVIGEANFGPNLSRIAAKLGTDGGDEESKRRWLVQWLLNPNVHNPRTRMPVTFLKPQDASNIATWLLSQKVEDYTEKDPLAPTYETLLDMARLYLSKAPGMTAKDVDLYLPRKEVPAGISDSKKTGMAADADERKLLTSEFKPKKSDKESDEEYKKRVQEHQEDQLLWYVGKKSINRLGCYGCHDIPGFESAKPIGTALNDWGKKDPERLAFEDSEAFVTEHFNIVDSRDDAKDKTKPDPRWKPKVVEEGGEKTVLEPYEKYFADGVEHHSRNGFLHLKLAEPRSFDFRRLRTWDDRLRMPQFQFSRPRRLKNETAEEFEIRRTREEAEAREAVMTFVLGLIAEPIPLKYVSNPSADKAAEVRGRQVIDKFNCVGCHQIRPGVYELKPTKDALDRLEKSFNLAVGNSDSAKDMPALKGDHLFPMHNAWVGIPSPYPDRMQVIGVSPKQEEIEREDNPDVKDKVLRLRLTDAVRFANNDKVVRDIPASSGVVLPMRDLLSRADPLGGVFVGLLVGKQNEDDEWQGYLTKAGQYKGKPDDAMSTLPPPLIREGERVQSKWLYQFLLNPTPIRPQTHMKLRMPRFNMSQEEAQALVNYFAAAAKLNNPGIGLTYPYEMIPERHGTYWAARSEEYIKENADDKKVEARAAAQLKDLEAQSAELEKAEKKDDTAIASVKKKIAELKGKIDKKNWADLRKEWLTPDVYETDAYKLLTNRNICLNCHHVGNIKKEGAIGPPLDLSAERLRPEWTQQWLSNPKRLFPYNTQMPQNFPNDQKDEKTGISKQWLESFYGTPREQARAVRDALMDLPRIADLPQNRMQPAGGK